MGHESIKVAVIDAGPLIHLKEIERLPLLDMFDRLWLPNAVWQETVGKARITSTQIERLPNLQRMSVAEGPLKIFLHAEKLEKLHAGERECLYVCKQEKVSIILTDDLAVRDAARSMEITPVGSLGIVVRAYSSGILSLEEAKHTIYNLQTISSLFVTKAIVEKAIEQLGNL